MKQKEALEILKLGHNVYLTGSAGSGKTYLLNEYVKFLKEKGVKADITASTGIAATHINGITIHSWSGMGIRDSLSEKDKNDFLKNNRLSRRFENAKILIIDEVSMLHHFQLDLVNDICRIFKKNDKPFGGLQVVLCGDFFQLPPISKGSGEARFIDQSRAWQNMNLRICYLEEQHRHRDSSLKQILNDVRTDNVGERTLESLRKRYRKPAFGTTVLTKLYTHNMDVDRLNGKELEGLSGTAKKYYLESRGSQKLVEVLKKSCLAPEELSLKKGAMVMFVKNNFEIGYVNGTLGKITGFDDNDMPVVETFQRKKVVAMPESWKIEEDGVVKAEIKQVPLRLAWAITVHKSQGMTLDVAEIDLSKSFVEGMGYVALSRLSSLDGLRLMGFNEMALKVNDKVLSLDKSLILASQNVSLELRAIDAREKEEKQKEFLKSILSKEKSTSAYSTYEETEKLVKQKMSIAEIAKKRELTESTIVGHLEKLLGKKIKLDLGYLKSSLPAERLEKIKKAFAKAKDFRLTPARQILGNSFSYDEIRLARLLLND